MKTELSKSIIHNLLLKIFQVRIAFLLCVFFSVILIQQPVNAVITGDTELLKLIADGYEVNLEKLRTWKGSAIVSSSKIFGEWSDERHPSNYKQESTYESNFLIDRELNANRWNSQTIKENVEEKGKVIKKEQMCFGGIAKGEYDYRLDFSKLKEFEDRPRTLLIRNKEIMPQNFLSDTFNPVYAIEKEIGRSSKMANKLRFYSENVNKTKTNGFITREGDIVKLETRYIGDKYNEFGEVVTQYVFDLSKGCNILEFSTINAQNENHWKLDYEKKSDVFVVKKISVTYKNKRPGFDFTTTKEATLTTEMVNEPIDSTEFEFDKIGLRPGDYILDHMAGGIKYQWLKNNVADEFLAEIDNIKASSTNNTKKESFEKITKDYNGLVVAPQKEDNLKSPDEFKGKKLNAVAIPYIPIIGLVTLCMVVLGVVLVRMKRKPVKEKEGI
jgi:hypothetical protein